MDSDIAATPTEDADIPTAAPAEDVDMQCAVSAALAYAALVARRELGGEICGAPTASTVAAALPWLREHLSTVVDQSGGRAVRTGRTRGGTPRARRGCLLPLAFGGWRLGPRRPVRSQRAGRRYAR